MSGQNQNERNADSYNTNYQTENRLGKAKKKPGVGQLILKFAGYLIALLAVSYLLGAASSWVDKRLEKVQEDAAEAVNSSNVQNDARTVYSQEELNAALAEAEQAISMRVEQASLTKEEEILGGIKTSLLDGSSLLEALRPYYPDEIVVASNGSYHFVPIDRSLKQSALVQENMEVLESGEYRYLQDGEVISHKGIDVSAHQGKIDWPKVAASGVEFAFIRGAFRGYGTGKMVEDMKFDENIKNANAAGIHVGVYVYSQAITEEEVLEEADFLLKKAAPYGLDIPIVIDVEKVIGTNGEDGRMNNLSVEERTNLVLLFCQTVENAGYQPMVYHNTEMGALMLDISALEDYPKWFASYSKTLYYPYEYGIWQYSDKGSVDGIKGNVDLDISFTKFWETNE